MAKITFTLDELIEILITNGLFPHQIIRVRIKDQKIHFVIRTNSFILPFIPASLRYESFSDNKAIFTLTIISAHLNKAIRWLNHSLKFRVPACMKLEYPNIYVDIDQLIREKNIKGVRIRDIYVDNGEVAVITDNI